MFHGVKTGISKSLATATWPSGNATFLMITLHYRSSVVFIVVKKKVETISQCL